jgi:hypothetical protein
VILQLTHLMHVLQDLKRKSMYNTRLCVAYTNAGRGREYFENYVKSNLEKSIGDEPTDSYFPLSGATYILIRNEDLLKDCKFQHFRGLF